MATHGTAYVPQRNLGTCRVESRNRTALTVYVDTTLITCVQAVLAEYGLTYYTIDDLGVLHVNVFTLDQLTILVTHKMAAVQPFVRVELKDVECALNLLEELDDRLGIPEPREYSMMVSVLG